MLSDNIRAVRKNKGFTQEDIANRLHVTRQTISKWEKGLSVPDAELLAGLADELEVPVSKLLGAEDIPTEQSDAIVEQLSRINEQLSIRNRRAKRIWKIAIIATVIFIIGPVILMAFQTFILSNSTGGELPGGYKGVTEWIYSADGQEYKYKIWYDDNYNCGTTSIDEKTDEEFEHELLSGDANDFQRQLEVYYEEKDGELIHKETKGLELKEY